MLKAAKNINIGRVLEKETKWKILVFNLSINKHENETIEIKFKRKDIRIIKETCRGIVRII